MNRYFYAFKTTFHQVHDKSLYHPADRAGKALEYQAFYGLKCVDGQYLLLCRPVCLL